MPIAAAIVEQTGKSRLTITAHNRRFFDTVRQSSSAALDPSGRLTLDLDISAHPMDVKRRIGVVPEDLALFDRLTAAETLSFIAQVHAPGPGEPAARWIRFDIVPEAIAPRWEPSRS